MDFLTGLDCQGIVDSQALFHPGTLAWTRGFNGRQSLVSWKDVLGHQLMI